MSKKYGRLPRGHDSRIPKMASLRAGQALAPLPPAVNYAMGMPPNLSEMLNDSLGDCTCAAVGHAIQTFSFNAAGPAGMITPSDAEIEALYETAGGYVPGNSATDNGALIQIVLTDWLNDPVDGNELAAFIELNPHDVSDMQRSIFECGVVDIGFNVPMFLQQNLEAAGSVWDDDPTGDTSIIGGHSVDLVGYDAGSGTYTLISWGVLYTMTQAFLNAFCDEAYALVNPAWIAATGKSPAGLSIADLETLMQSMKGTSPPQHRIHRAHRKHHLPPP